MRSRFGKNATEERSGITAQNPLEDGRALTPVVPIAVTLATCLGDMLEQAQNGRDDDDVVRFSVRLAVVPTETIVLGLCCGPIGSLRIALLRQIRSERACAQTLGIEGIS
jgi:hypothetical protein